MHSAYWLSGQIIEKRLILGILCLFLPQQSQRRWNVSMSGLSTSLLTPWWIKTSPALRSSARTQIASKRGSVSAAGRTVVIILATMPRKRGTRGTPRCTSKPGQACLSEVTLSPLYALKQVFHLYPPSKYHVVDQGTSQPRRCGQHR